MNKFLILILVVILNISCTSNKKITISSKNDLSGSKIELLTPDSIYDISFNNSNIIELSLVDHFKPTFAYLRTDGVKHSIFINNGLNIEINKTDKGYLLTFSGEGAKENNYLNETKYEKVIDFNLDEKEYLEKVNNYNETQCKRLEASNLNSDFVKLEKVRIKYIHATGVNNYKSVHKFRFKTYTPSETYNNLFESYKELDASYIDIPEYFKWFRTYIYHNTRRPHPYENFAFLKNSIEAANTLPKDEIVISRLIYSLIEDHLYRSSFSKLDSVKMLMDKYVTDKRSRIDFNKLTAPLFKVQPGMKSPEFSYPDINNKMVKLSDLVGKYVYIDFWATWCGPCCKELPYMIELEEKYKDDDIYFVGISTDKDKNVWKKAVKEKGLKGIQLNINDDYDFYNAYSIFMIPRFILLDKKGHIINSNMTRPSDPKTTELLDKLLKK